MSSSPSKNRRPLVGGAAVALLLIAACARLPGERSEGPRAARSEVEQGPVRVTVVVEPAEVTLSDEPTMTLTIDSRRGVTVEKPLFGEAIGDIRIRGEKQSEPRVKGDRRIVERVFTLEPTRTGSLPIWPIAVTFTDAHDGRSPGGDGKQYTIETEQLTIEVGTTIESRPESLDKLRKEAPPVPLPSTAGWFVWVSVAAVLLLSGGVLVWWLRARRERAALAVLLTPRERADLALRKLRQSGLAERDVKLYYVELTGIVRRYVEETTGIRAPEQTTEEFLREISRQETFPAEQSRRLKDFLESADLVKFAKHEPLAEDIEHSYQRAESLIGFQQHRLPWPEETIA